MRRAQTNRFLHMRARVWACVQEKKMEHAFILNTSIQYGSNAPLKAEAGSAGQFGPWKRTWSMGLTKIQKANSNQVGSVGEQHRGNLSL